MSILMAAIIFNDNIGHWDLLNQHHCYHCPRQISVPPLRLKYVIFIHLQPVNTGLRVLISIADESK